MWHSKNVRTFNGQTSEQNFKRDVVEKLMTESIISDWAYAACVVDAICLKKPKHNFATIFISDIYFHENVTYSFRQTFNAIIGK